LSDVLVGWWVVVVQVPIWCAVIMHVLKDRDRDVGRAREPRF
jgi:hypothetical protein